MTAFLKRLSGLARSRKAQLALALRVTVAAVGAFAIASALHLMLPLWAVLTALIVTQMSVGRSLKATRDYMLGTVGGAIYGGAIAVLIPHSGEIGLLALLVLAVAPLAFIAAVNPSLNAASGTAVVVLLVPEMSHAQRRPDARPARRRGGAVFRAGIFAGANAAESKRLGALRR